MKPPKKIDTVLSDSRDTIDNPTPPGLVTRRRVVAVVFLMMIAVLLTSTLLVIGGVLTFRNAEASFWKRTSGVLLDAHVDRHDQSKDQKPDIPVVKYEYMVDGKRIVSDKWSPAGF